MESFDSVVNDTKKSIGQMLETMKLIERLSEQLELARQALANDQTALDLTLRRLVGAVNEVLEDDLK